jgi:hypothetical protein
VSLWARFLAWAQSRPGLGPVAPAWVRWHDLAYSQRVERSDVFRALLKVSSCFGTSAAIDPAWLVAELRHGRDVTIDRLRITHDDADVLVAFLDHVTRCPLDGLVAELERLGARHEAPTALATTDADQDRFLSLARAHSLRDPALADAWRFVLDGIAWRCIGPANLDMVIETTRHRVGFGFDEYFFDFEPEDGDLLGIRIVQDVARCAPDAMVAELEELRRRYLEPRGGK